MHFVYYLWFIANMRSVGMAMNNDFEIIESSAPFLVGETTGLSNIFLLMKTSVPSGIEFFFSANAVSTKKLHNRRTILPHTNNGVDGASV